MMDWIAKHSDTLAAAIETARKRTYWSAYPEVPSGKIYGETAKADGEAAFQAMLGKPFDLDQPGGTRLGAERSPYGFDLGVTYPAAEPDALVAAAEAAMAGWGEAAPETRAGVALEILARLNARSFLIAQAVMHTSGQSFVMAFQAGGPHAQDRGLEAVAYAYEAMMAIPRGATWEKPQGKAPPLVLEKAFRIVPRGVALVIACATFPTWNGYPGLFASLVTGNAVIVKPHPHAILPLAITVKIAREVLAEAGFDPNVVLLAPDTVEAPVTKALALHPDVAIVDFTGSAAFGSWLRENVAAKLLYTEETGVNSIVVDATDDWRGMAGNIAFSLSLYSGQMCTAPRAIFVPEGGIETDEGHKSFDAVAAGLAEAVDRLLGDPDRAAGVLGAIQSEATLARIAAAERLGRVARASRRVAIPGFEAARAASPLIVAVGAEAAAAYGEERFGPIAFVVATKNTEQSIEIATRLARDKGAITASLYATDEAVIGRASDAFARAGAPLSVNLTGGVFVNQSAAFSDFHVTGANPAGTACLTDPAFVADRFRVATVRRWVTPAAA